MVAVNKGLEMLYSSNSPTHFIRHNKLLAYRKEEEHFLLFNKGILNRIGRWLD